MGITKPDQKPSEILSDPALQTRWTFGTLTTSVQVNDQGHQVICGCQAALLLRAAGSQIPQYSTEDALRTLHETYGIPYPVLNEAVRLNDRLTDEEASRYVNTEAWDARFTMLRQIAARKLPEVAAYYREQGY